MWVTVTAKNSGQGYIGTNVFLSGIFCSYCYVNVDMFLCICLGEDDFFLRIYPSQRARLRFIWVSLRARLRVSVCDCVCAEECARVRVCV